MTLSRDLNRKNAALVSIILCVYNGEQYLRKQIDSILNQTYSNFELLILDDNSTDNSLDIIKNYTDSRIKIFVNKQNVGFNKNFEKGISLGKGDFIAISDQDDIWLPNKIEELLLNIKDDTLVYSNSKLIDEHDQQLNQTLDYKIRHLDKPDYKSFLDDNYISGHTTLFKKELTKYILPFPPEILFYDWWICFTASYIGSVKYIDKILTSYRVHSNSVMQKIKKDKAVKSITRNKRIKQMEEFSKAAFLDSNDRDFIRTFLAYKSNAKINFIQYLKCYLFLLKHHTEIYPWYRKSFIKKLNFIRKEYLV